MKAAKNLSATLTSEHSPANETPGICLPQVDREDESDPIDQTLFISTLQDDSEYLGVGATTVEDVIGLHFLDSLRRQVPDPFEEHSKYGPGCEFFALELESDA